MLLLFIDFWEIHLKLGLSCQDVDQGRHVIKYNKLLSELDRLRNLRWKNFLADPPDNVLSDYLLVKEELHQHILIPKQIAKNITKEFFDQQKLVLYIWRELNLTESVMKSEGSLNQ